MLQGVQDLNFLTTSFHKSPAVCTYCGVTAKQGELWYWLQKSMGRPPADGLKTLVDVLGYLQQGRAHPRWDELIALWYVTNNHLLILTVRIIHGSLVHYQYVTNISFLLLITRGFGYYCSVADYPY